MTNLLAIALVALIHPTEDRFTQFAGMDLGKMTLAAVVGQYGESPIRDSGHAGRHERWICYSAPKAEVRFMSGDFGGNPKIQATRFSGVSIGSIKKTLGCAAPQRPLADRFDGIKLGMARQDFLAAVQHPVEWDGGKGRTMYQYEKLAEEGTRMDVLVTIEGSFSQGRLVAFSVSRMESP